MKHIRSSAFVLAVLALFLAACGRTSLPDTDSSLNVAPQFGTTASDSATGLAKYSSGVYVVGTTSGKLHATPQGGDDVFLRKVDSRGNLVWGRQFGTSARERATDVATDAHGNAYVLGTTSGMLARSLRGPSDFFLRKYSASGSVAWTLQFGLETEDIPGGLVVSGNHVYVVGAHQDIGKVIYRFSLASGSTGFKKQFADDLNGYSTGVTSDSSGNLYTASTINVGCTDQDVYNPTDSCARVLIEKFNQAGTRLWSKQLLFDAQGEPRRNSILDLTSYGNNIYLVVDGFAIPNDDSVTRLVKLDTAGALKWDKSIGSVYSYGYFSSSFDLSADNTGVYFGVTTNYNLPGDDPDDEWSTYSYSKFSSLGTAIWQVGTYGFTDGFGTDIYGSLNAILAGGGSLYIAGLVDQSESGSVSDAFLKRANPVTGAVIWDR